MLAIAVSDPVLYVNEGSTGRRRVRGWEQV